MNIIFTLFSQFILGYAFVYMGVPNKYGYSFGSPFISITACTVYLGFMTNNIISFGIDNHIDTLTIVTVYIVIVIPLWAGIEFGRKTLTDT